MNPLISEIEESEPANSIYWDALEVPPRDTLILMVMLQACAAILVMIRFDWFPLPGIDWTDPDALPLKLGLAFIVPVTLLGPGRPELLFAVIAGMRLELPSDALNGWIALAIVTLFILSLASYLHSLARKWSDMDSMEKVLLPILTVVALVECFIVYKCGLLLLVILFDVSFAPQFG